MSGPAAGGYRRRPWELQLLTVAFVLVPVFSLLVWSLPGWLAGQADAPWRALQAQFATARFGVWGSLHAAWIVVLWLLFWAVAWGIHRVTPWGFFLCIATAVLNSLFSAVIYSVTDSGSGPVEQLGFQLLNPGVLLNLVFFVPILVLLRQTIMTPFFNPKLKWWEQHPRVRARLQIQASPGGQSRTFESFDISASGMFLGTGEVPDLKPGQDFPAVILLADKRELIEVVCKTAWVSDGKGRAPAGCGVTFRFARRGQRRILERYIKGMLKLGHGIERT